MSEEPHDIIEEYREKEAEKAQRELEKKREKTKYGDKVES